MISSLYVAERGAGPKTVVFLHGFGGCHGDWHEVISTLTPGSRTLAYDLPGHGLSLDFPGGGPARIVASSPSISVRARRDHISPQFMSSIQARPRLTSAAPSI